MNSILSKLLIFTTGVGLGSAVTYMVVKNKYERLIQEEIDSVKAVFSNRDNWEPVESEKETEVEAPVNTKKEQLAMDLSQYEEVLNESNYKNYAEKKEENKVDRPYVIEPGEFGEMDGYETVSLTYYADEVVTDDFGDIVDDVDDIIGLESLSHFGEYEDDSVFVRNDAKRCDYEILMVEQRYYER